MTYIKRSATKLLDEFRYIAKSDNCRIDEVDPNVCFDLIDAYCFTSRLLDKTPDHIFKLLIAELVYLEPKLTDTLS